MIIVKSEIKNTDLILYWLQANDGLSCDVLDLIDPQQHSALQIGHISILHLLIDDPTQ